MKYLKPFIASLAVAFFITNAAYASALNITNVLPNKIPQTIQFFLNQPEGKQATLFFPNSTLPAKFLCYFAASNNQQYKGLSAHITSEKSKLNFMNNGNLLEAGRNDVVMFTATAIGGPEKIGSVDITLDGNLSAFQGKTITMICTMSK